jgi:dolichol kinase
MRRISSVDQDSKVLLDNNVGRDHLKYVNEKLVQGTIAMFLFNIYAIIFCITESPLLLTPAFLFVYFTILIIVSFVGSFLIYKYYKKVDNIVVYLYIIDLFQVMIFVALFLSITKKADVIVGQLRLYY